MKLVLLPGMDGTGELFQPLLSHIELSYSVMTLPQGGKQDYVTLTEWFLSQLPDEDFVLLAESFSGPIAARVAQASPEFLKGVVFVATFLSPPHALWLNIARHLPLKALLKVPFSSAVIRAIFLGRFAGEEQLLSFRLALKMVPESVLHQRITAIAQLTKSNFICDAPVLYLQATHDRLIPHQQWHEFAACFTTFSRVVLGGPHFILQAEPEECAYAIQGFIDNRVGAT